MSAQNGRSKPPHPIWAVVDSLSTVHGRVQAPEWHTALHLARSVFPEVTDLNVMLMRSVAPQLRDIARSFPVVTLERARKHGLVIPEPQPVRQWVDQLRGKFAKAAGGGH